MELKEKMNSYTEQPDAEVYSRIEKSMRRRRLARRTAMIVPAAAVVVGLVVALRPAPQAEVAQVEIAPVEMVQTEASVVAPQDALEAVPVVEAPQPQKSAVAPKPDAQASTPMAAHSPQTTNASQMAALPASVQAQAQPATPQLRTPNPTPVVASPLSSALPQQPAATPAAEKLQEKLQEKQPAMAQQQEVKAPVVVDPEEVPEFYIPNAFAPEGDDPAVRTFHFTLRPGYMVDNFKLYIFNRGGRQVFYSTDINRCWDGSYKGVAQPTGNYVYKMQYRDAEGNLKVIAGNVTLIRK